MSITLPAGFTITNNEPGDDRCVTANSGSRYAISVNNAYNGMIVYQVDTEVVWVLKDKTNIGNVNGWSQVGAGGGGSGVRQFDGLITTNANPINITTLLNADLVTPNITSNATGIYTLEFGGSPLLVDKTHVQINAGAIPNAGVPVSVHWEFDSILPDRIINFYTYGDKSLADNLLEKASISVKVYP